jgi:LacI family transcriptional regulator
VSIRMQDVADVVGVSLKTVSRVVNGEPAVRPELRARVLAAIEQLGFQPDPVARGLVTKKTRTIGLMVPDIANPFFPHSIAGCVALAERAGYNVSLGSTDDSPAREVRHVRAMLAQRVSGIIMWANTMNNSQFLEVMSHAKHTCPMVFVDCAFSDETRQRVPHRSIWVDHQFIGRLATEHLLALGRERIALISPRPDDGRPTEASFWAPQEQRRGYREALLAHGITPDERWVCYVPHATMHHGAMAGAALLSRSPRPDSIFAYNDVLAIGVLLACRRMQVRVPEDVAVVGMDNTELAVVVQPQLTSIRLHQYQVAQHATALLLDLIGANDVAPRPATGVPCPELVPRRSSMLQASDSSLRGMTTAYGDLLDEVDFELLPDDECVPDHQLDDGSTVSQAK